MSKRIYTFIGYAFVVFLFCALIPVLFNFLLQVQTGFAIIGAKDDASVWLAFWGAYMAAIGSFCVAYISLKLNKNSIKQNDKLLHNMAWDKLVKRYDILEKFIMQDELLHNECFLDEIQQYTDNIADKEEKSINAFLSFLIRKKMLLNIQSIKIARFVEQDKANQYHNDTGLNLFDYGCSLNKVNIGLIKLVDILINNLQYGNRPNLKSISSNNHNDLCELKCKCNSLIDLRSKVLQSERERILNYAKKYNIENGIL